MSGAAHPAWSALWDSIKSLFRLSTIVALVLAFGIATALKHAASPDLSGPVFGASATLVALIVPTAALANTYLEGRMLEYLAKIQTGGAAENIADVATSVKQHAKRVVASVRPLLRGFIFFLIGFGFSVAALFKSTDPIWPSGPRWVRLPLSDLYVGGALGFDSVGVLLLFPFAWNLLDRQLAEKTSKLIDWQAEKYRLENVAAQAAAGEGTTGEGTTGEGPAAQGPAAQGPAAQGPAEKTVS